MRYPKAGETNPTLRLFVWKVGEAERKAVLPPSQVTDWGEYIYTIADWTGKDVLRSRLNFDLVIVIRQYL